MKNVKLTVLFKNGVEKKYIVCDMTESQIDKVKNMLYESMGKHGNIQFRGEIILSLSEIASAEIEILQP